MLILKDNKCTMGGKSNRKEVAVGRTESCSENCDQRNKMIKREYLGHKIDADGNVLEDSYWAHAIIGNKQL